MLMSRRNQLLLEFSFWNEPVPRDGPNIYELRSYQLRVRNTPGSLSHRYGCMCACDGLDSREERSLQNQDPVFNTLLFIRQLLGDF